MVRAGYHWSDRTTVGHLQSYVSSKVKYDPFYKNYDINCFEGIMQALFDKCHEYASKGYYRYTFMWLSNKLDKKEYTLEEVVEQCEECFIECKISLRNRHNINDDLVGYAITIDWKNTHEELWNHAKYLGQYYDRKDHK